MFNRLVLQPTTSCNRDTKDDPLAHPSASAASPGSVGTT